MAKKRKKKKRNKSNKKKIQSPMDQILAAINSTEWENAEKLLKKEIEKNPTAGCHYYLGHVYRCTSDFANNRLDEALLQQEIALKLCEDKSKSGWIYYEIGKIYKDYHYDEQDNKKALEYFKKAIACASTAYDTYKQIGYLYTWEEVDKKIEVYKKGIEKFPSNKSCYLLCARCLTSHKKDYYAAEAILLNAIQNKIESAEVYYELGEIKIKQEMFDEAISYYKNIFDLKDNPNLHSKINFIIASTYIKKESYNDAEKFLIKALTHDKEFNNFIYFGFILCSQIKEKSDIAIDFFRKLDFSNNEDFRFCGRKHPGFGEECCLLDNNTEMHIDCNDIMTKAIDSLESTQEQFDKNLNHKLFLLKACVLEKNEKYEESLPYLESALNEAESGLLWDMYRTVFEYMIYDENDNYKKGRALTQYYNLYKKTIKKIPVLGTILKDSSLPDLKDSSLNKLVSTLFEVKKYKQIVEICELHNQDDLTEILFEAAYSYNEIENYETAQLLYEKYLENCPESTATLNNLANLYKKNGRIEEAINLYKKAIEIDPDDELVSKNLQTALDQRKEAQDEQEKQTRIRKVAITHWPSLDYYKKKVLMVLNTIDGYNSIDELADLCNMEVRWVTAHYRKLVELGMVIENEDRFEINPEIKPLIERENSHSVAINVIRSDENINFKPIFNSKLEYNIYRLMIGLFPNHLVFPNMSLQSIFTYDRMKDVLDSEVFKFYLLTSVDICIISTANYLPILCYEVDSPYHDAPDQIARDEKKNEIFEAGGTPLIRLRPHGKPSDMEIREKIIKSIQEFGKSLDPLEKRNEPVLQLLKNID